jgi:hypothetical protein
MPKSIFPAWPQDPFVAQMYILLILQSQYFKPEKAGRFRAGCKRGLWVDLCGLHPARKRSNGGLGALEDCPQLNKRPPRAGGLWNVRAVRLFNIMALWDGFGFGGGTVRPYHKKLLCYVALVSRAGKAGGYPNGWCFCISVFRASICACLYCSVALGRLCPANTCTSLMSLPALNRFMIALCRMACGVSCRAGYR